jgi:hypothetical protein
MDKRIDARRLEQDFFQLVKTRRREFANEGVANVKLEEFCAVLAHLVVQADLEIVDVVRPVAFISGLACTHDRAGVGAFLANRIRSGRNTCALGAPVFQLPWD